MGSACLPISEWKAPRRGEWYGGRTGSLAAFPLVQNIVHPSRSLPPERSLNLGLRLWGRKQYSPLSEAPPLSASTSKLNLLLFHPSPEGAGST